MELKEQLEVARAARRLRAKFEKMDRRELLELAITLSLEKEARESEATEDVFPNDVA